MTDTDTIERLGNPDWTSPSGIKIWELGEEGELLVTTGRVDKEEFATAVDDYTREAWGESLSTGYADGAGGVAEEVAHRKAHFVDPPALLGCRFEIAYGDREDSFDITMWQAPA